MIHKFDTKSIVLGAVLGAAIMFSVAAASTNGKTWEYKVLSGRVASNSLHSPLAPQLDQAATDGWEVVSAANDEGVPFVILRRAK